MARSLFLLFALLGLVLGSAFAQEVPPVLALEGDPAVGAEIAQGCAGCHTADGNSTVAMFPRLAGQHVDYLKVQLFVFKIGARPGTMMNPVAAALSDQQIADVAAYFASQEPNGAPWPDLAPDQVERGATIFHAGVVADNVIACAICHGSSGAGIAATTAPRIAGQSPDYLRAVLAEFRAVEDFGVPAANAMHVVASNLTETDLEAVIAFLASQPWGGEASAGQ